MDGRKNKDMEMKDNKITIYTFTHKLFNGPKDSIFVPLQVGSAMHEHLPYLHDDSGDNISELNKYYSELTGFYWAWRNDRDSDYIGTCHYRRYLLRDGISELNREKSGGLSQSEGKGNNTYKDEVNSQILVREDYERLLKKYDIITTKLEHLEVSYREAFAANHNVNVLDETGNVIKELYPDYYDTFVRLVNAGDTYYCNMLVTNRRLFMEYCDWLFNIFFTVGKRVSLENGEDAYHKRVFGFVSEFLLTVWIKVRQKQEGLRVCECKVGLLGEKAETREIKKKLAGFIVKNDVEGAIAYFMRVHRERPDITMEAADVTGELRLLLEVIAIADAERRAGIKTIIEGCNDYHKLMEAVSKLNAMVMRNDENACIGKSQSKITEAAQADEEYSSVATEVAKLLMLGKSLEM